MTDCPIGKHTFPFEDDTGAYCEVHGVAVLFRGDPITPDDLGSNNCPTSDVRPARAGFGDRHREG
ncbi:hypothetical protein [Streptomyces sp. NBC_01500]|uniref:hypothetical protein n=1 Tax=Streptomyces sp. NBC_01500 TaxID=2903886 RepID=UPI002254ED0B|nr:hypothetical protein [Streptomyces sp. NBC_01500]MCX4551402.1 hypothetical protein [Streptomyces sp. NBC_01500]